ncbi:Alpha carbonic anhydrase [Penicillium italicum]|uniref:Alpha carbonic anhydrase n=1 Tax=Penicillium italicum TaxID=40296 RepID=A0A0A2KTH1_PENIT|nr:Alpha carbonic anhydrase [Penicillium italicum]
MIRHSSYYIYRGLIHTPPLGNRTPLWQITDERGPYRQLCKQKST